MEMTTCVVCFNETSEFLVPCAHTICRSCALEWLSRTSTCPMCRADVASPSSTLANTTLHSNRSLKVRLLCIPVSKKASSTHLGMTVSRGSTGGIRGVCVIRLDPKDMAKAAGLRVGDLITHVNDIRVTEHEDAIRILECAKRHAVPVMLQVASPRSKWSIGFHEIWSRSFGRGARTESG
mgnify:CR=1 FL=1